MRYEKSSGYPEFNENGIFFIQAPARSWIEATFTKRECIKYVPHPKYENKCCCDRTLEQHKFITENSEKIQTEIWLPSKCTAAFPTDAYGTVEFQGGPHPSKAQYIRLAYDTKPEHIIQLITKEWSLELPKLLISIQGGKANFELQPKLKKVLRKGLLKAARSTGAWIFTGGTNTGVTKHVGDVLLLERSQRTGRVITLGITPWGIVENNQELIGHNKEVPYHSISSPRSRFAALNNRHAYFLLVDNGTIGKYGAEIVLRRKLEKHISKQRLYPFTQSPIPIVCLVIEGGTNTIRAVLEYVTDDPPVPVVVCDGSGRAADLISFVYRYELRVLKVLKDYIIGTIQRAFEVPLDLAEVLFGELLQCVQNKNLITIYRIAEKNDQTRHELDQTILTALFKSQHLSPTEQLSLALTWNRSDIARSEIFIYGQEWPPGALEDAMMKALEHDRCDFVKLLLENGVSMRKFLTIPRLENLYNSKQGPSNTLQYILRDVRPHIPEGYVYTLHDIGLVINKLMGGAYRAFYTRRKFRPIYAKVMNKGQNLQRNSSSFAKQYGNAMSLLAGALPSSANPCLFDYPFNELLIWAVLMKRHKMALLMWQHGEEALAKALVACKLFKAMAHEAAEDDMETEVYEELRSYGKEFENIALEVLDYCYRQDDDQTQQLLTCELQNWSGQTCLSLAVAANHRALLAHPCSQIILADLWMGGLRTRKNTNLKVILGLLFPLYILSLEFKSKEELQLMPQTTEEHMELENEDDDKSDSEKIPDAEHKLIRNNKRVVRNHIKVTPKPKHYIIQFKTKKNARTLSIRGRATNPQGVKALLTETFGRSDVFLQENGKPFGGLEDGRAFSDFGKMPKQRQLRVRKKLYEFYTAPITKFWANSIAYIVFLVIFSYLVLVKMSFTPSWYEWFCIAFICSLGCEKIRELFSSEPVSIAQKLAVWSWNMWNPCDMAAVLFFLIGVTFRMQPDTFDHGRVIYCVNSIYWYLRILNILSVNKYLGPLVTMMGKMVKNMIYFVVLLLIVLMSFGVTRQAINNPDQEASWSIARDVFLEPYFMLYGEVYANKIDPTCGPGGEEPVCRTGRWITPFIMSIYLLVANILLINLLIAVFNNIFNEVNAVSHQVWMFQRFTVVMEYEQKPLLPPPFIILSHFYLFCKYLKRKMAGQEESYDNGLKLFLDRDEMERLYDFEEDCVEGYFAEQELKLQQSTEERIKVTTERIEHLTQKVEDINTKENANSTAMQGFEVRFRRLQDDTQNIIEQLLEIQKILSGGNAVSTIPEEGVPRERTLSENSEGGTEEHIIPNIFPPSLTRKRMMIRSLTEVRPDAYIFDNGQHIEYRHTEEEEDAFNEQERIEALPRTTSKQTLTNERVRKKSSDSKTSVDSVDKLDSNFVSADDLAALSLDVLRSRVAQRRRDSASGRRNSDGNGNGEEPVQPAKVNFPRRQFSHTQSEPETSEPPPSASGLPPHRLGVTFAEPKIKVFPPSSSTQNINPRSSILMHMHTEYTSITDELETVCGLLSPPRSPGLLSPPRPEQSPPFNGLTGSEERLIRHFNHPRITEIRAAKFEIGQRRRNHSEMSNPEIAINLEKEHLRSAEESDYMVMENLIQRRYDEDDGSSSEQDEPFATTLLKVQSESRDFRLNSWPSRTLQRVSAVDTEPPPTPSSPKPMIGFSPDTSTERQDSTDSGDITLISQPPPPKRPSIVMDSSQLPIQREIHLQKADSKASLHMQSETMC
ncbi:transient receptor potential cation channel trpm isoform X5 [Coccinella septempunctata]|uniref:transient receptor potential cation channel trpm isoform X5 n=1 Tax=Coccinella septempunctata TaxID=41139 RepID=UPI001D0902BE|nr:transient receptor potential cation channel trpm isoform X5 [Coccinella septempunctata]